MSANDANASRLRVGWTTQPEYVTACPPPWVAFPEIQPTISSHTCGNVAAEPWFDRQWRPFWSSLDAEQREQYLQHWSASLAWREAMSDFEADPELGVEADARESNEYLGDWAERRPNAPPCWRRLFQRKR